MRDASRRPSCTRACLTGGPPRPLAIGVVLLLILFAAQVRQASAVEPISTIAVFPVENLSGGSVPADAITAFLVERLNAAGVTVLPRGVLDDFMTRHRIRYAAGIDAATARWLREETGVDGVVIASVELSNDGIPPKIALIARLVSTAAVPTVIWADAAGMSGDDAPGLLDLRVVTDYGVLLRRALDGLARSLLGYLDTGQPRPDVKRAAKFRPRVAYRGLNLDPGKVYSVAVLPFYNVSDRRNAGEVLALLFMRHLASIDRVRVIDAGEVRQQLLQGRVIMDGGISISDADLVGSILDADFVLAGRVLYYEDFEGPEGRTRVDFSTVLIERNSRKVVWSSHSYNEGSDGVRFFGRGRSTTAHTMATQMARLATEQMVAGRR